MSRLDALTARLRADGVTVVDLRPALRSARAEGARFAGWPLYFRTDSHWNTLGGLLAARPVLAALQQRFPSVHVPIDEEITVSSAETGGGDLARMDGLQGAVTDLWVRARVRTSGCVVDPFDPAAASPETPTELPGRLDCPGAPIRRALVLHDSMMAAMLPFLSPAFERTTLLRSPLLPDRLAAESPDVVILEVVERTLYEGLPVVISTASLLVVVFVFGLLVGSFLNVVIARVPHGQSIVRPGSRCPRCGHVLAWYENVPLLSWAVLRGRCRSCRAPISIRYPAVELLTGLLFLAAAWAFGPGWLLLRALLLVGFLVPLALIDLEHWIVPVGVTVLGTAAGLASAVPLGWEQLRTAPSAPRRGSWSSGRWSGSRSSWW